eukprot:scaffold9038_cov54-Phaeocystis_antarctica.AAC.3
MSRVLAVSDPASSEAELRTLALQAAKRCSKGQGVARGAVRGVAEPSRPTPRAAGVGAGVSGRAHARVGRERAALRLGRAADRARSLRREHGEAVDRLIGVQNNAGGSRLEAGQARWGWIAPQAACCPQNGTPPQSMGVKLDVCGVWCESQG